MFQSDLQIRVGISIHGRGWWEKTLWNSPGEYNGQNIWNWGVPQHLQKALKPYSPNSIGHALRMAVNFSFNSDIDTSAITCLVFSLSWRCTPQIFFYYQSHPWAKHLIATATLRVAVFPPLSSFKYSKNNCLHHLICLFRYLSIHPFDEYIKAAITSRTQAWKSHCLGLSPFSITFYSCKLEESI